MNQSDKRGKISNFDSFSRPCCKINEPRHIGLWGFVFILFKLCWFSSVLFHMDIIFTQILCDRVYTVCLHDSMIFISYFEGNFAS